MAPVIPEITLPASAEDINSRDTYLETVRKLISCITTAVTEGKSVTAANKRLICSAAEEIRRATRVLETTLASTLTPPTPSPPATNEGLKEEIIACVREEFKRHRQLPPLTLQSQVRPSYAQAAAPNPRKPALTTKPTPKTYPATKPAIIVSAKTEVKTKQDIIEAWRRNISFKNSGFAPSRVQAVSNNKLRIEFDNIEQRNDTLTRITNSQTIHAEPARRLLPMLNLKGVSKDVPAEDLVSIISRQNPELTNAINQKEDLRFRFQRSNRNPNLYNAILIAQPTVWRKCISLGRISVDHQRIHVEEFTPFLQCHKCLSFGHTKNKCSSTEQYCAHCSESTHTTADCPNKAVLKCINCVKHNIRHKTSITTTHSATSHNCPQLLSMKLRITDRIDYGTD